MNSRPLIALTTGSRHNCLNKAHLYTQSVQKAGGMAEFVHPGRAKAGLIDYFDGFLIPGGKDIDPLRYNEKQDREISIEDPGRTDFELWVLKEATKRSKPVLGICYGMQLINVFFGGSLYQNIQSEIPDSLDHRTGPHTVTAQPNYFLKSGDHIVNSSHHQALKKIGKGLVPFAFAEDGLIEGVYLAGAAFLLGLQWHPERMETGLSRAVFSSFLEACHEP